MPAGAPRGGGPARQHSVDGDTSSSRVANQGRTDARIRIRPSVDGEPHGEHFFTEVVAAGSSDIDTVSIACDAGRGLHTVQLPRPRAR